MSFLIALWSFVPSRLVTTTKTTADSFGLEREFGLCSNHVLTQPPRLDDLGNERISEAVAARLVIVHNVDRLADLVLRRGQDGSFERQWNGRRLFIVAGRGRHAPGFRGCNGPSRLTGGLDLALASVFELAGHIEFLSLARSSSLNISSTVLLPFIFLAISESQRPFSSASSRCEDKPQQTR